MYIYRGERYNNIQEILDRNLESHNNRLLQELANRSYIKRQKAVYDGKYEFICLENNEIIIR